jgi:hypothetical protein
VPTTRKSEDEEESAREKRIRFLERFHFLLITIIAWMIKEERNTEDAARILELSSSSIAREGVIQGRAEGKIDEILQELRSPPTTAESSAGEVESVSTVVCVGEGRSRKESRREMEDLAEVIARLSAIATRSDRRGHGGGQEGRRD